MGSAQLLGRMLDRAYRYHWSFVDVDTDEQAIAALKAGEVAAVFCMSGWPSNTIDAIGRESSLVLVAYDLPVQSPYQLVRKNYPHAGVFNLPFLAAPNLLVTRPFKPEGTRGKQVAALQRCILGHLDVLQEGAFEPGWKEIRNADDVYGWPKFGAGAQMTSKR